MDKLNVFPPSVRSDPIVKGVGVKGEKHERHEHLPGMQCLLDSSPNCKQLPSEPQALCTIGWADPLPSEQLMIVPTVPAQIASAPLDTVRAALGLSRGSPVPEVLQASARVRSTRTAEGKGPGKYREVELRPRAGPSSLPVPVPGMVQVFVSAIVDSTFGGGGNVAGLAAKVVQVSGSHQPCLLSALVNDEHVSVTDELPNAAAPAAV
eukprot:scaffold28436_cov18-Tisochrysis_lutea.AAC.1